MNKKCTQCSAPFEVTDDDLAFYDKVSPIFNGKKELIPVPTHCPSCRLQRRLAFRNERKLYHRKCDKTGKQIISIYAPDKPYVVYEQTEWWNDDWDALEYGKPFNFTRPFFEQYDALMHSVPRLSLICEQSENCTYDHNTTFSKNCYLCFSCFGCEDSSYAYMMTKCNNTIDVLSVSHCERCYECVNVRGCYGSIALQNCADCKDSILCFDCIGCTRCFGCVGLRNADLHIFNKRVTEEEYQQHKELMQSYQAFTQAKSYFETFKLGFPQRGAFIINSENCTGDHIQHSRNVRECFEVEDCEDSAYCNHVNNFTDSRDVYGALMGGELQYENSAAGGCNRVMGAYLSWHNNESYYLNYCHNSNHLFGCISLRKKQYCILNKQYTKEEYEELVPRIIAHMRETGEWGEFFPVSISPYAYNETMAMEYFPLAKTDIEAQGWRWYEEETNEQKYMGPAPEIADDIRNIGDDICTKILRCSVTEKPYKIIPQELALYREMGIPIPRKCPDQRHKERMALRNPRRLWKRNCMKCQKEMETTYAPDRTEIIYCEDCYLSTVY